MTDEPFTENDILAHMGVLLINTQRFESLLLQALKQIYAGTADLAKEKILAQDKRTLGQLIKDLKKKTEIEEEAKTLLETVLKDRNMFVHNLGNQAWFETTSEIGRKNVMKFLAPYTHDLNLAIRLFTAVHINHGDDIGYRSEAFEILRQDERWNLKDLFPHAKKIKKKG